MPFLLRRKAARVLCFNGAQQLLLISAVDPADHKKPPWWELPGGGIDAGETPPDTCRREFREEAGIDDAIVGPCVWTQHAQFSFGGFDFDQHERIHVATSSGQATEPTALESLEALAFVAMKWWNVEDLIAESPPTVPPRLLEFLPDIAGGQRPDPPIDISPL